MSAILDALRKAQTEKWLTETCPTRGVDPLIDSRVPSVQNSPYYRALYLGMSGICLIALVAWLLYAPAKKTTSDAKSSTNTQESAITPQQTTSGPTVPQASPAQPASQIASIQQMGVKTIAEQRPSSTIVLSAPDDVILTGIAWQATPRLRKAIINDTIVGEGSLLKDYKVREIRHQTVRRERGGSLYEATIRR